MISQTCVRDRTVVVPKGAMVLDIIKDIDRFVIVPVIDIVGGCPHIPLIIALRRHLLVTAVLVLTGKCACEEVVEEIIPVGLELSVVSAACIAGAVRTSAGVSICA